MKVQRQFVQVGARRVMVRHAGRGPAVVLVHQSPQSSRALLPWIERLAAQYAVFAPDTPGFGHSDPLPLAAPSITDYAEALAELLGALGLQRVLVFGMHTGAAIATQLALAHPQHVAGLVTDGLSLFDAEECASLLAHYVPPFEPQWDGSHLRWLFARLREQHLFFPWYDGRRAARLRYPLPAPERVHADVLDLLDAGDGYRAAYRAAFQYAPRGALPSLQVPALLAWRAGDVLAPHAPRCPALPAASRAAVLMGGEGELVKCTDNHFAACAAGATVADAAASMAAAPAATRRIVAAGGVEWAFHLAPGGDAPARLSLGDIGQPAAVPESGAGPRIAVELPGHGASLAAAELDVAMPRLAAALHEALAALLPATAPLELQAQGAGAVLARHLARALGARCTALQTAGLPPADAAARRHFLQQLPALTPDAQGGHLLAAWDWARQSQLFDPWQPATAAGVLDAPAPDPQRLHEHVREVLRAGPLHAALWRAALDEE